MPAPSFAQSYESQTCSCGEVSPPALSQGSSSLSGSEVPSTAVTSPPKPVLTYLLYFICLSRSGLTGSI